MGNKGPLGAPRPFGIGPLTTSEEEEENETKEQSNTENNWEEKSWENEENNERNDNDNKKEKNDKINLNEKNIDDDVDIENIDDKTTRAALEMAESWYSSITKDQSKHKMMKHFLQGVTELTDEEIEEILNNANI